MENQAVNPQPEQNIPTSQKSYRKYIITALILVVILVGGGVGAYKYFYQSISNKQIKPNTTSSTNQSAENVMVVQSSDIINFNDIYISDLAKEKLLENQFVVVSEQYSEFYSLYENNRYDAMPNFITTDSILHNYHLLFNHLLKKLEEESLIPILDELNQKMLAQAVTDYNHLKGTEWENAAKRNLGFFAVASKLRDSKISVPEAVNDLVAQELTLIEAHEGISESPLMNIGTPRGTAIDTPQGTLGLDALKEDYSQYIPRGHYDFNEELASYFKTMMWYGRLTFRFKSEDEIRSAVLITLALQDTEIQKLWEKIYEPTNFFVGESDDIVYKQVFDVMVDIYGDAVNLALIREDAGPEGFEELTTKLNSLEGPKVNSMPIFNSQIQPDREKEIAGFRFMGQRFTLDASIFQRLLDRETPERMLPRGLDIPAAFGSDEAFAILEDLGETNYVSYTENMAQIKDYIVGLNDDVWTSNLYWGWMHSLRPLVFGKPVEAPAFMKTQAWMRKDLNTFLGSWTELKHDTILYAKQAYAELGGGPSETEIDDRGYVEPNVEVYKRLSLLIEKTKEGLLDRNILSDSNKENLDRMKTLVGSLQVIAQKELAKESLTEDEYELIRSYGGQLEHFWLEVYKDEMEKRGMGANDFLVENPAAIVADVATDPNGEVLEEATGYVFPIYVIVDVGGKNKVAKGGVYSYYEFVQPMSERLTDKKWRELLSSENPPELPDWTQIFSVQLSKDNT